MSDLAILVPVLNRPHRVRPLLDSIYATSPSGSATRVMFLCDRGDEEEIAVVRAEIGRYDYLECEGENYAEKIATGVRCTTEPLIFLGADDLEFKAGWFEAATAAMQESVQVVGVNDLLTRSREHATHFLMTRAYAERPTIDGSPGPLFQGYSHWFVDDELIATARQRGVYAYCPEAVVRHLHPAGGIAPDDATYRKGREHMHLDRQLFRGRSHLWTAR